VGGTAHLVDRRIAPLVLIIRLRTVLHEPPHHRQLARPCGLKDGRVAVPVRLGDHLGPELLQHRLGLHQVAVRACTAELGVLVVLLRVGVRREFGRRWREGRARRSLPNVLRVLVQQRN